jgi:hypothetical protein
MSHVLPLPARSWRGLYSTLAAAFLLSATAFGISRALEPSRSLISPHEYADTKDAIDTQARMATALCREQQGQPADLCKATAQANERIVRADLEALYRGTTVAAAQAKLARAVAHYDIAKVICAGYHGQEKFSCLVAVRAGRAKAVAEAALVSS